MLAFFVQVTAASIASFCAAVMLSVADASGHLKQPDCSLLDA
jgi:hypothetical protein